MRFFRTAVFCILLIVILNILPSAYAEEPQVVGETAVLMDFETGQVLYEKKADQKMYPASTTKMLTAIIALEMGKLDEEVVVSDNADGTEGSSIWLKKGEKLTLEDLLYALMLNSANDAAVAIAEHFAGSVDEFADIMNKTAAAYGAKNTNFTNPHGLPDENHYTTAYDLAVIARHALKNPTFTKIVQTKTKVIDRTHYVEPTMLLINHNRLLWLYDGAIGVKTGYTTEAQQCIVAAAQKDGRTLIAVVMKTQGQNIWTDAKQLLDYGFNNYQIKKILSKGDVVGKTTPKYSEKEIPLLASQDVYYNFPIDYQPDIQKKVEMPVEPAAPLAKGAELGTVAIYDGAELISDVKFVSGAAVERPLKTYLWYKLLPIIAVLLIVCLIIRFFKRKNRRIYRIRRIRRR